MSAKIYLEKPIDDREIYRLAEVTDLVFRRLRNRNYSRRYAATVLEDEHTALEAAAAKIIKSVPVGKHPVDVVNERNLAVLRIGTMSFKRVTCLGANGRFYTGLRGRLFEDGRFIPTAETLKAGFALFETKNDKNLRRVATLQPTVEYFN